MFLNSSFSLESKGSGGIGVCVELPLRASHMLRIILVDQSLLWHPSSKK